MPKPYPREFRDDVVAVARRGETPLKQVAKDFGISESCLANWLRAADVEDGARPGVTREESAELRELRKRNRLLEQENEVLRKAAAYLAQGNLPKIAFPLVRELAAAGAPVRVPVAVTCRVLGFSRQAYYQWCSAPVSQRDWDDAQLINAALEIHADDPADASENRVWRICSMQQIFSLHAKKKGQPKKAGPPVHDDLVRRDFTADAPNTKWLTDITEHPTGEGKLYLCAVKDCYSNKIVGYSIASHMRASLAVSALRNAISLRDPHGVVVHSDRGAQFRSAAYQRLLRSHGLTGSMGRVGACGDNAAMESFFSLLQKNVLDTRRWRTREELRLAIVSWIETKYHRKRRQRGLGKLTPVEFETIYTTASAA
ncbi:IS3 family transposase [Amycolatopsis sp. SID8362]|uniref:IS3 family transposase n=1 Tax=Amycolatopsis sp. SID8362 TaxID=2690346 RepID=UPI00136B5878|nr:IS3 family transposase [Amycolatopsis sp. SID8362]NBH09088.1 IS3 family transposase [Amycolatopsis sp. SID8362]NED45780.1 IS3 family transposase [Amycolatopsis sp. SID8362]